VTLIISNQWATSATVEAIFHVSGHVNRRNFRRRCIESQQHTHERIPVAFSWTNGVGRSQARFSCIRKLSYGVSVSA
jgi:hypothetical protein